MYVKSLVLSICLTFLPVQQQADQSIALVFGPRSEDVVILKKSEVARIPRNHPLVQKYGIERVNAARLIALATFPGTTPDIVLTPAERKACLSQKICMCCQ